MAKNFNEYKTAVQSNYSYPESFNATFKAPVIAKRIWATYADALGWINDPKDNAIVGLQISIINDTDPKKNGIYMVTKIGVGETDDAGNYIGGELEKVGSTPVLEATNYDEALTKAVDAPVGSLINVLNAQGSVEDGNYRAAGFYIVSVNGSTPVILFLSTSTGESLDLDAVISNLATAEGKITVLEGIVSDPNTGLVKKVNDVTTVANDAKTLAEANAEAIGNKNTAADGGSNATGLYKIIEDVATELGDQITSIPKFDIKVVPSLESVTEPDKATVYLVTTGEETQNLYTEYIYTEGKWEKLGTQTVDLTDYITTGTLSTTVAEIDDKIAAVKVNVNVDGATGTYVTVGATVDQATGRTITLSIDETALKTILGGLEDRIKANEDALNAVDDKIAEVKVDIDTTGATGTYVTVGATVDQATGRTITLTVNDDGLKDEIDALNIFKTSMSGYSQFVTDTNASLGDLNTFKGLFDNSNSITNGEVNTMNSDDIDNAITASLMI